MNDNNQFVHSESECSSRKQMPSVSKNPPALAVGIMSILINLNLYYILYYNLYGL